jgi:hypothetical protein
MRDPKRSVSETDADELNFFSRRKVSHINCPGGEDANEEKVSAGHRRRDPRLLFRSVSGDTFSESCVIVQSVKNPFMNLVG